MEETGRQSDLLESPKTPAAGIDHRSLSPFGTSAALACGYAVLCGAYIWLSGLIALQMTDSAAQLAQVEKIKGILFVLVTALGIFVASLRLLTNLRNREAEILRQRAVLVAAERRALAGLFAASIAHDINNILLIIENAAGLLEIKGAVAEREKGMLTILNEAADKASGLARRLSQIGKETIPGQPKRFDLNTVLTATVDLARQHSSVRNCSVTVRADSLEFTGNQESIEQMLINLLLNAADATSGRGTMEVRLVPVDNGAAIEVHDSGPGIPASEQAKIFDPFFSTKGTGRGLGLLSVSACAQLHNGKVSISQSPLGGACFRVELHQLGAAAREAA